MYKHHRGNYKKLAKFLQKNDYIVTKTIRAKDKYGPGYTQYSISGKGITGVFCPQKVWYKQLFKRIAVDNNDAFNKWSQTPLVMKMENIDYNLLLERMKFISSKEGFEMSNNFDRLIYEMEN